MKDVGPSASEVLTAMLRFGVWPLVWLVATEPDERTVQAMLEVERKFTKGSRDPEDAGWLVPWDEPDLGPLGPLENF